MATTAARIGTRIDNQSICVPISISWCHSSNAQSTSKRSLTHVLCETCTAKGAGSGGDIDWRQLSMAIDVIDMTNTCSAVPLSVQARLVDSIDVHNKNCVHVLPILLQTNVFAVGTLPDLLAKLQSKPKLIFEFWSHVGDVSESLMVDSLKNCLSKPTTDSDTDQLACLILRHRFTHSTLSRELMRLTNQECTQLCKLLTRVLLEMSNHGSKHELNQNQCHNWCNAFLDAVGSRVLNDTDLADHIMLLDNAVHVLSELAESYNNLLEKWDRSEKEVNNIDMTENDDYVIETLVL